MSFRSRFTRAAVIACLAACGGAPHDPVKPLPAPAPAPAPDRGGHLAELERPPAQKLLAIDWPNVHLESDAQALALWKQIAPTGADWEARLAEIPNDAPIAGALAIALLREGNFTCVPTTPPADCKKSPTDVDPPAASASLSDPCLRRMLAMWSIDQLDEADLPRVHDALRAIAAVPPPESQLVASAIKAVPETDPSGRLELLAIAWRAGQRELVNGMLGALDEPQLIEAATKVHIDGALDLLTAESHRAVFVGAVTDPQLPAAARIQAMIDLAAADAVPKVGAPPSHADKLAPDLRAAFAAAARTPDCMVAAAAARILDQHGDHRFVPKRPRVRTAEPMMRAICVLASWQTQQQPDQASLLRDYLPARGLELEKIAYDPYNEVDADGDGDPHTVRTLDLIPRADAVLPEIEEVVAALHHCAGASCRSEDHELRFTFKAGTGGELMLWRLEIADRPPCGEKRAIPAP